MRRCLLMIGLWLLFASAHVARADFITQVLADKPKGFWVLNDASTTAADSSGNSITGTYGSKVTPQGISGPSWVPTPHNVANFTGGTLVPGDTSINFASPLDLGASVFTIQAWINPSSASLSTTTRIVASGSDGVDGYGFGTAADGRLLYTAFGDKDYMTAANTLEANKWQYVGIVVDAGENVHFYLNGSLVDTQLTNGVVAAPTEKLTFGNQSPGVNHLDQIYIGGLAGISIFDEALSSKQIEDQYTASLPEPSSLVLTGLVAFGAGYTWWRRRRKAISAVPQ